MANDFNELDYKQMNDAYDNIDDMLLGGCWELCDQYLQKVAVETGAAPVLLTILSAAHPAKEHLPAYAPLVERIRVEFAKRGLSPLLLQGLE